MTFLFGTIRDSLIAQIVLAYRLQGISYRLHKPVETYDLSCPSSEYLGLSGGTSRSFARPFYPIQPFYAPLLSGIKDQHQELWLFLNQNEV